MHLPVKVLFASFLALAPSVVAAVGPLRTWETQQAEAAADAAISRYGYATLYDNVSGLTARP